MMLQENTSFVKQKIIKPVKNVMPLIKSSWKMSWPMMVMMVFEFLISMTDIYIAGLYGKEVKAATGLASQVYALFIMTGHALTIGAVSILSRLYTSEDKKLFKSKHPPAGRGYPAGNDGPHINRLYRRSGRTSLPV